MIRKRKSDRKRSSRTKGRKYPRRSLWIQRRDEAFERAGETCEISKEPLGYFVGVVGQSKWKWRRAADHTIPERWVRRFIKGADPHILENLIVITPSLHAKKTAIERRIYKGDYIGYLQALRCLGWEQWRIDRALKALAESASRTRAGVHTHPCADCKTPYPCRCMFPRVTLADDLARCAECRKKALASLVRQG